MTVGQGDVAIRAATRADAAAIAACVERAYRHYIERIGRPPRPMLDDYVRVTAEREVFVAESDRSIAGVLVLAETPDGFLLDNVAVHPSYRGTGIGRRLLALAESRARTAGYTSIYLYTHVQMTENSALYAKIGYVEYDRGTENGLARVYLRKPLTDPGGT